MHFNFSKESKLSQEMFSDFSAQKHSKGCNKSNLKHQNLCCNIHNNLANLKIVFMSFNNIRMLVKCNKSAVILFKNDIVQNCTELYSYTEY